MNPVEEGFVNHESEWKYSSASNYHEKESILPEVYCIPARLQTIR